MRALMGEFTTKLAALTNFHFTPFKPEAVVTVPTTVPAVALEEGSRRPIARI